jgi:hypothetical protein
MILIENNFDGVQRIVESADGKKKTYLVGTFMESETRNRNGRIYDKKEIEAAVNKINDAAKLNRHILSHLDHPNHLDIKLEDVAMKLMEAKMEGNQVWCKAQVLETLPKGQILKGLLDEGITIGVSSRGSGQVDESTGRVRNFNFITVDAVAQPSANAYPETIQEQLEYYKRGNVIEDLSEAVIHDPMAQQYFQLEMKKFINEVLLKK